jgi:hypothetical protein
MQIFSKFFIEIQMSCKQEHLSDDDATLRNQDALGIRG